MGLNFFVGGYEMGKPICLGLRHNHSIEGVPRPLLASCHIRNVREWEITDTNAEFVFDFSQNIARRQGGAVHFIEIFEFDERHG